MSQQLKDRIQIARDINNAIVANTEADDLTDSGVLANEVRGTSAEIEEGYRQLVLLSKAFDLLEAEGEDLDQRVKEITGPLGTGIERLGPTRSTGFCVFSRASNPGLSTTDAINIGQRLKSDDGVDIVVLSKAVVTDTSPAQITGHAVGVDSGQALCACVSPGATTVPAGSVRSFSGRPANIVAVTNVSAITGGRNSESDDDLRQRAMQWLLDLSRCTRKSLDAKVRETTVTVSGVELRLVQASVFKDPNDPGHVLIYVDDGRGTTEVSSTVTTEDIVGGGKAVAFGGEEFFRLENKPVKTSSAFALYYTPAGGSEIALTMGDGTALDGDYRLNPADGTIWLRQPLETGDALRVGPYTHYKVTNSLIAEGQRLIDGDVLYEDTADPVTGKTYPGNVAAGVLARVLPRIVRTVSVVGALTYLEGYDQAAVLANVKAAIANYANALPRDSTGNAFFVVTEVIAAAQIVPGVFDIALSEPTSNKLILYYQTLRLEEDDIDIV